MILFNVDEAPCGTDGKKHDSNFITSFLNICEVVLQLKDIVRVGAFKSDKNRSQKLVMKTIEEKKQVQSRLLNLKEAEMTCQKIIVRDDYTQRLRKVVSNIIGKAEERSKKENTARGTPEIGLNLVKINQRR